MITYMGWTLLGVSDDFDPMKSVDLPSMILAQVLLAFFLIMGVILLINMLIALLSNTYQRIEVNEFWNKLLKKGKIPFEFSGVVIYISYGAFFWLWHQKNGLDYFCHPSESILCSEHVFHCEAKIRVFKTWIFDSKTEKMPMTVPLSEHMTDKIHIYVSKLLVLFFEVHFW